LQREIQLRQEEEE